MTLTKLSFGYKALFSSLTMCDHEKALFWVVAPPPAGSIGMSCLALLSHTTGLARGQHTTHQFRHFQAQIALFVC